MKINIANLCHNDETGVLKEFLNHTLKEMMKISSAEGGSLFLFDCQNQELILNSFYNSAPLDIKGLKKRVGEGVSGKVINARVPILVKDINADSNFEYNGFKHYKTASFISIPLFTADGVIGLINLTDKASGEPFCEKDLEAAVTLSKYACVTIDSLNHCMELRDEKEALKKQKVHLEKYASVGKLAAGIVHEINNPLDGVIRYTNMLLAQMEGNSVAREYLLEVKNGLHRIANITKSLLDFSHQVNVNASQVKKCVDLHALIDDSLCALSEKIDDNNIIVDKLYACNPSKILDLGLSHVFINIIRNAVDSMPEGGKLKVYTDASDRLVRIIFKDTGAGIPDEIKERIFEPFFTTKGLNKGTGLGLAICSEIINKYGGKIEAGNNNEDKKGSVFNILIPRKYLENAE